MMNHLTRITLASVLSTLLGLNPTFALVDSTPSPKKGYSLATDIADHYLPSFPSDVNAEQEEKKQKKKRAPKVQPVKLDEFTKRNVVLNKLFTKSNTFSLLQQFKEPILNEYAWSDLKLLYGTTSKPSYHLMSHINRTITTLGEGVLATMLVTPTSSIEELQKRQRITKTMLDNPAEVRKLQDRLRNYKATEQNILSFWTKTDPLYSKTYTDYMNRKFYSRKNHAFNKSAARLELKKRWRRDFWNIGFNCMYPFLFIGGFEVGGLFSTTFREESREVYPFILPFYSLFHIWENVEPENRKLKILTLPAIMSLMYTWACYTGVKNYQDYASVLRHLALRMADIQSFLLTATQLSECIASFPALEEVYGARLASLRKLLDPPKENREFGKLIHSLQRMPLRSWSYFFNNAGKLLASYKIFLEHKDEFADAFYEFGQLDVFVATAQLMQEAQEQGGNSYGFTQFLDRGQKSKPYIKLEGMWNPFIDANRAIPNSIEMDAGTGGVRNIILTGPNAGGKSTFLTGVTTALLLSQTLGIAPGKEIVITPFNKINTYINIADDIATGKSLFMAEVDRAQKHIKILEGLPKDEFSFSIMDELFSGTNPREGEAAAYSIMEYIGAYDNALSIIATHFPRVMLLEENVEGKNFVNYKVFITRKGPDKKLNYNHKIVPGKSNQAIAIDILEEQGYNTKMLERARDILANPEKYRATF